jgi:hypothetical protein
LIVRINHSQVIHYNFNAFYLGVLYRSNTLLSDSDITGESDNAAALAYMNWDSLQPAVGPDPAFHFRNHLCGGDHIGYTGNRMNQTLSRQPANW